MVSPIVIATLNDRWRVVDDGEVQWILQVRKGQETLKSTGWRDRRFHLSRTGLCASIRELCGPIAPEAETALDQLQENYTTTARAHGRRVTDDSCPTKAILYDPESRNPRRCSAEG
jgi:hypothetical protein